MPMVLAGRRLVLTVLSVLLMAGGSWVASPRASADESTKVLLLLDVSGSMNEKISSGGTKFAAAKKALKQVANALPAGTQVGLRVYGSTIAEPKEQNPKACTDTKLVLPIGPLDTSRMDKAVDSFTAKGETPIAYSLGTSVDDLGSSGKRVLILISDGEETCSGDPCPTARKLAKSGVDLQFNAIGLDVNSKARKQLQCIAKAGDGSYYDAGDSGALQDAVNKLTQRALRPFEVSGTPLKGTLKVGDAPEIGGGQYRDHYDVSNKPRYYTINRTPGSLVTASIGTVVKPFGLYNADQWSLRLTTMDGDLCSETQTLSGSLTAATVYGGVVRSDYPSELASAPAPGCATDPQLRWSLSRQAPGGGGTAEVPVELIVAEQPPVTNLASLPGQVQGYDGKGKAVGTSKPVRQVVGGSGFSNAPRIGAGTWSDTVTVADTVVYRVPLDYGQRLRATVIAPSGPDSGLDSYGDVTVHLTLYSPARVAMKELYESAGLHEKASVTAASPRVRVRNRETPLAGNGNGAILTPDSSTASTAGDYFVGVKLDPIQRSLSGNPMSVRVGIAVDGKPSGQPQYAAAASASPTPTPGTPSATAAPTFSTSPPPATPGATTSGSSGRGFAVGLVTGVGVVALLAAGVWLVVRRRLRSR